MTDKAYSLTFTHAVDIILFMKIGEIFAGTPAEKAATATIATLSNRSTLSKKSQNELSQAKQLRSGLTRRRLIASGVGGGLAVSTAALIASGALRMLNPDHETPGESTYSFYLNAYEEVVQGDEEAERMLDFFKQKRRKGYLRGDQIIADEKGEKGDFYTVIVDLNNKKAMDSMKGFAQFKQKDTPPSLMLKPARLDKKWAGVLLAHESVHVYQWLNGIEQSRPNGFLEGEVDAYDLEFRLLDKITNNKLKQVLREQATQIEKGKIRGRLSSEDMKRLSELLPPIKSPEEYSLALPALTIAFNFAVAELQYQSPIEIKKAKIDYIEGVFSGKFPIIPA